MNRRTKPLLPMSESLLVPRECPDESAQRAHHKAQQARYYNQGATDLLPLQPRDIVRIQPRPSSSTWQKGTVQKKVGIRSYQVKADGDTGGTYVRNRRHLRRSHEVTTKKHPLQTQSQNNAMHSPQLQGNNQPASRRVIPRERSTGEASQVFGRLHHLDKSCQ